MTNEDHGRDANSIQKREESAIIDAIASPLAVNQYHPLWEYLPKDIKAEEEKAEKYKAHLLAEMRKIQQGMAQRQEAIAIWREQNLRYTPEDMLEDREWHHYYPAIKHTNDPLIGNNPLSKATERDPQEQRILATGLLRGTLSKAQISQLTERAQKLICSTDAMNATFLTGDDLNNALKQEKLTSKEAINRALNRKATTYCKQDDQREALKTRWETRDRIALQQAGARTGDWGEDEAEVLWTCTIRIIDSICRPVTGRKWNPDGYAEEELKLGLWGILQEAEKRGISHNYHLDPREKDEMEWVAECIEDLSKQPHEEWHYAYQRGEHPGQKWVREIGMPLLYGGGTDDWWEEMPDITSDSTRRQDILDYISMTMSTARRGGEGTIRESWDMATACLQECNLDAILKGEER